MSQVIVYTATFGTIGDQLQKPVQAANVDYVFLVSGLDRNYNPARIQRFLVATRESGAEPVIVLNKTDLHDDPESVKTEIETLVPGVRVLLTNTTRRRGFGDLRKLAAPGATLAFVGSSGVGKSTLANLLSQDDFLPTGDVREKDSKGRHSTDPSHMPKAHREHLSWSPSRIIQWAATIGPHCAQAARQKMLKALFRLVENSEAIAFQGHEHQAVSIHDEVDGVGRQCVFVVGVAQIVAQHKRMGVKNAEPVVEEAAIN